MARQRILGLPIGKKKKSPARQAAKAAGMAAAVLAPAVAIPVGRKVSKATGQARNVVNKTREAGGQVSDVLDTASSVKDSVSGHSTGIGKVGGAVKALAGHSGDSGDSGGSSAPKLSHLIEEHTDIAAARSVVYNQWTQFEMFPTLVKGIESVEQEEDDKAKWTAKIGPSRRTWTGKITEQVPDERIAWESEGGVQLKGVVTFHSLDVDLTRVLLQMEYHPSGPVEWVGNTLRIQRRRARRDLRTFKHFVELRGEETGAWRGRIGDDAENGDDSGNGGGDGEEQSRSRSRSGGRTSQGGRQPPRPASSRAGSSPAGGSSPASGGRRAGGSRPSGSRSSGERSSTGRTNGTRSSGGGRSRSSGANGSRSGGDGSSNGTRARGERGASRASTGRTGQGSRSAAGSRA